MAQAAYATLSAGEHRYSEVIEGSEFLAFACRADDPAQAQALLASLRGRYEDATHHCWAYQVGALYRFSDDGEPGGTAGQPILRAIQGAGLEHVCVVVVRYYGGTKLGTGGLMRAYGSAAAGCLRRAQRVQVRPRVSVRLSVAYEHVSALYHLLGQYDHLRGEEDYSGGAGLMLEVGLYPEDRATFVQALGDATRGQAVAEDVVVEGVGSAES